MVAEWLRAKFTILITPSHASTFNPLVTNGLFHSYQLDISHFHNTPGIYAEGCIVFVFPFVRSYVRSFVCSFVRSFVCTSFRRVEFASKFCVEVSQVVYISATTHQKAFKFGTYTAAQHTFSKDLYRHVISSISIRAC